ncbi:hypothetical protein IZ6_05180 [Terrihabitans soli]|uniref:Lysophospholipid acyltransferase family protein n=1 Tax=Terrihabitans soli TaxID=708113 RepID=A0A6S6QFC6_9HYPH|nr:hypothetical protein [Terrihabitans soli]BCJ89783.1 hypothetical protein IZ6_05180 [Terrihabitans soli]
MASTMVRAASAQDAADRLISRNDLLFAASLPVLMPLAWLTPAGAKQRLSRLIASIVASLRAGSAQKAAEAYAAPFGLADTREFFIAAQSEFQLERLNLFALHSPLCALPETRLTGIEHLSKALASGRGALLWVVATAHSRTETKLSLFREGFRTHHLSRSFHGFSRTRFGKAFLNPIRTRIEQRFLASRVVIEDGQVAEALAELARRLAANEIVSITMGTEARRLAHTPFLAGRLSLATRPMALAHQTGAAILPVVTTRNADGVFTTAIGRPLTLPKDSSCDEDDARALSALAEFLKPHVLAFPAQFARAEIFGPAEGS